MVDQVCNATVNPGVRKTRGATALTYRLVVGLVAVAGIAAVTRVGESVDSLFGDVSSTLTDASDGTMGGGNETEATPAVSCDPAAFSALNTSTPTASASVSVGANVADCVFTITVEGAGGGSGHSGQRPGGSGAGVRFTFTPGVAGQFEYLVGGRGREGDVGSAIQQATIGGGGGAEDDPSAEDGGSGGGASAIRFVPDGGGDAILLAVAGGGGGGGDDSPAAQMEGRGGGDGSRANGPNGGNGGPRQTVA